MEDYSDLFDDLVDVDEYEDLWYDDLNAFYMQPGYSIEEELFGEVDIDEDLAYSNYGWEKGIDY